MLLLRCLLLLGLFSSGEARGLRHSDEYLVPSPSAGFTDAATFTMYSYLDYYDDDRWTYDAWMRAFHDPTRSPPVPSSWSARVDE